MRRREEKVKRVLAVGKAFAILTFIHQSQQAFEAKPESERSYDALHAELKGILFAKSKFKAIARIVGRAAIAGSRASSDMKPQTSAKPGSKAPSSAKGAPSKIDSKACVLM